jgi:hypothetical protein
LVTIVSTHLNGTAPVHLIYIKENESQPLKTGFNSAEIKMIMIIIVIIPSCPSFSYCEGLSSLIYLLTELEVHQEVVTVAVD